MPQGPYNPQEVLAPLLHRFGRHLLGDLKEGYARMVSVLTEELHLDAEHAAGLLENLKHAGLIAYEHAEPAGQGPELPSWQSHSGSEEAPKETDEALTHGSWRIGPCL